MRRWPAAAVAALTLAAVTTARPGPARGHVAAARDSNNRHPPLTLLGDRVRLAYTIYYGELPGAVERRRLDRDRDGRLGDDETAVLGDALAAEVAATLQVTVDGVAVATTWATTDVGLGMPVTAAGSFAVDLIAWYCLPATARHTLVVRDGHQVPRPGETEIHIDDTAGVRVDVARLGAQLLPELVAQWEGAGGPLVDDGLTVVFETTASAARLADRVCTATAAGRGWATLAALVALAMVVIAGIAGAIWRRGVRRRSSRDRRA